MTTKTRRRISTYLALAMIPLSGFATDIYIPSLPQMGVDLQVSSLQVQMTLSIFLISYGVSQLFIGAILDSFGRYRLGLVSLLLFAIASTIIANTHNIFLIYAMRVVHGLTVATIVVAKRAYFVDVYKGDELKSYLSIFTIIWSAGPIIAPFIGGYLQDAFGWNFNFYFLAGMAVLLAILDLFFSAETLPHRAAFDFRKITATYYKMITTPSFTLGLIMLGFAYSMAMVYNLTGPFIVQHHFGLSPVVAGYCSLILGLSWMLGGFIGKATIGGLVGGVVFIIVSFLSYGVVSFIPAKNGLNLSLSYLLLVVFSFGILYCLFKIRRKSKE